MAKKMMIANACAIFISFRSLEPVIYVFLLPSPYYNTIFAGGKLIFLYRFEFFSYIFTILLVLGRSISDSF